MTKDYMAPRPKLRELERRRREAHAQILLLEWTLAQAPGPGAKKKAEKQLAHQMRLRAQFTASIAVEELIAGAGL